MAKTKLAKAIENATTETGTSAAFELGDFVQVLPGSDWGNSVGYVDSIKDDGSIVVLINAADKVSFAADQLTYA